MLNTVALFTGILGLVFIVLSLAYRLLGTQPKTCGWLVSIGVLLIIASWVLFIIPEAELPA